MSVDQLVNKALKRIGQVHPVVKKSAEEMIRRAYKDGIYVLFSDGYRTYAEQNALYDQGRTKAGNVVTNARGGESYHNFGLALDYFLTNKKGTTASWKMNSNFKRAASIAKDLGFEWGGDWKSIKDYTHIQMTGGLSLAQLRAGKKPKLNLKTTVKLEKPETKIRTEKSMKKIVTIQKMLNKRYGLQLPIDNKYGSNTKKALIKGYQLELHKQFNARLVVDGIWGPRTREVTVSVGKGANGNLTQILQAALVMKGYAISIDGEFGTATEKAVRSLQKASRISVDGVAGKTTFSKLFGDEH